MKKQYLYLVQEQNVSGLKIYIGDSIENIEKELNVKVIGIIGEVNE